MPTTTTKITHPDGTTIEVVTTADAHDAGDGGGTITAAQALALMPVARKACKGDGSKEALEAVLKICQFAVPSWAGVVLADCTTESLAGGYQGTVPLKCSAKGATPPSVVFKLPDDEFAGITEDEKVSLPGAAYMAFSRLGIVPTAYCMGDDRLPGLQISEFVGGGNAGKIASGHGADFLHNKEDAISFAKLYATMHKSNFHETPEYVPFKGKIQDWNLDGALQLSAEFSSFEPGLAAFIAMLKGKGDDFADCANMAEGLAGMQKSMFGLFDPGSVLGRNVFGHGDAHGCNLMHRNKDGHGDLVAVDLDIVGVIPVDLEYSNNPNPSPQSTAG